MSLLIDRVLAALTKEEQETYVCFLRECVNDPPGISGSGGYTGSIASMVFATPSEKLEALRKMSAAVDTIGPIDTLLGLSKSKDDSAPVVRLSEDVTNEYLTGARYIAQQIVDGMIGANETSTQTAEFLLASLVTWISVEEHRTKLLSLQPNME